MSAERTHFNRENDWVFAIEFQDVEQCKGYCAKWGITEGMGGKYELFKRIESMIDGTVFAKQLVNDGWNMSPFAYVGYQGKTRTGREAEVFLSGGGRRILILIPG